MIARIVEVEPGERRTGVRVDNPAMRRPMPETTDGLVSVERFRCLANPRRLPSLSIWRDGAAIARRRNHAAHRETRRIARAGVFDDHRLRVAGLMHDDAMPGRAVAAAGSRAAR